MMQFNSIGSFIGSRYTNRARLVSGMRSSFVDSIGVLDGGPPGTRTPNLRIKRCPHTLRRITEVRNNRPPCVPYVQTAPGIGSELGSTGSLFTHPSTYLLIVSNTLNGFSYRHTQNTQNLRRSKQVQQRNAHSTYVGAYTKHTKPNALERTIKKHCATGVQGLHGAGVLCYCLSTFAGVGFAIDWEQSILTNLEASRLVGRRDADREKIAGKGAMPEAVRLPDVRDAREFERLGVNSDSAHFSVASRLQMNKRRCISRMRFPNRG